MIPAVTAVLFDSIVGKWASFVDPVELLSASSVATVRETLATVEAKSRSSTLWAVGWVSYEAAPAFDSALHVRGGGSFPLLWFALFPEPIWSEQCPVEAPATSVQLTWRAEIERQEYMEKVCEIRESIGRGETYQVNFTFRLNAKAQIDPRALFATMVGVQDGRHSALIETPEWAVVSASPELFFSREGKAITCKPMKGTAARGTSDSSDDFAKNQLRLSVKERAENVMIVDMLRNDLSKVAARGSVSVADLFSIETFPNVHQMTSMVCAKSDRSTGEIFAALFPSASITGAPKVAAMKSIANKERSPRQVYCGAIGFIARERELFNVAIRTALLDKHNNCLQYSVGSGIVWDSEPALEFEECWQKASVVLSASAAFELFETLLWDPTVGFTYLAEHLNRLKRSANFFGWQCTLSQVAESLKIFSQGAPTTSHRVRVFLNSRGQCRIDASDLVSLPSAYRISLACDPIDSGDISLCHKTTSRKAYDNAVARDPTAHDVLLWNERGEITESRIANIAIRSRGEMFTPPVSSGLLPGVYRAQLIKEGVLKERVLVLKDIELADEVFLLNSVRGMWSVTLCDAPRCEGRDSDAPPYVPALVYSDRTCTTNAPLDSPDTV
jgi:para-aminobenzoate synthetase/4-amino-4-deoxychorismate lyase